MRGARDLTADEQRDLAKAAAQEILHRGRPVSWFAGEHDVKPATVRYLMKKHGFGGPKTDRAETADIFIGDDNCTLDNVVHLRRQGYSWDAISAMIVYGKSGAALASTVRYQARKAGLEWPIKITA